MNDLLTELTEIITNLKLSVVTGVHGTDDISGKNEYIVLIPMNYDLTGYADDTSWDEVQEIRLSLFHRGDFMAIMRGLTKSLLKTDITITDRRYVGWERNSKYHHYVIDVSKNYYFNLEDE